MQLMPPRAEIAGALLLTIGCASAGMTTYSPVSEKTKYSADTLYRAARDAAGELGFQVIGTEGTADAFDTREKQVAISSIPRLSYKYSFHVETSDGVLSIKAS